MKRIEPIILIAAVGFYALAMTSQGILPWLDKKSTRTETVQTIYGTTVPSPQRTALEELGRKVYIREGCWYCHSQYIRPVNRDTDKWGPVTQAGEMAYDLPQMFGTRRIGPELSREGAIAAPTSGTTRTTGIRVPSSRSPSCRPLPWLSRGRPDARFRRCRRSSASTTRTTTAASPRASSTRTATATLTTGRNCRRSGRIHGRVAGAAGWDQTGDGVLDMHDYGPEPTEEMVAVEAYMQMLGTSIGDWRIWEPCADQ